MPDYPNWLLQLVAGLEEHEFLHESAEDGSGRHCLLPLLSGVPVEVKAMARGYAQAKREEHTDG